MIVILRIGSITDLDPAEFARMEAGDWREVFLLELVPILERRVNLLRALETAPTDGTGWLVFTSANAVRFTLAFMEGRVRASSPGQQFAPWNVSAIGAKTAEELGRHGISVGLIPSSADGATLAQSLRSHGAQRILWPNNLSRRKELGDALREGGFSLEEVSIYAEERSPTAERELSELLDSGVVEALGFTSENTVRAFHAWLAETGRDFQRQYPNMRFGAIGPSTLQALVRSGVERVLVPQEPSVEALVEALRPLS